MKYTDAYTINLLFFNFSAFLIFSFQYLATTFFGLCRCLTDIFLKKNLILSIGAKKILNKFKPFLIKN